MNYSKEEGTFLSSNGENQIRYYVYTPVGEIRAMLQISHGMCEYVERYEPFIEYITEKGILVFGNDHLGHKGSVKSKEDLGYMGHSGGWKCMYEDVHTLSKMMRKKYPQLQLFLFGHSMGSFIARSALANFASDYDGAIICRTSGANSMAEIGLKLVRLVRRIRGERVRSVFLTKMLFGKYNSRYKNVKNGYEWLSRDENVVKKYMEDEDCMFVFTAAGYEDLLNVLCYVSSDNWYNLIPEELPLFIISGDMDPVGTWGDGVREVDEKLRSKERADYKMKLYPDMRHEILNETGKEEVYRDILDWIEARIPLAQTSSTESK